MSMQLGLLILRRTCLIDELTVGMHVDHNSGYFLSLCSIYGVQGSSKQVYWDYTRVSI